MPDTPTKPRRRWLSFSLGTLFVVVACCWAVGRLLASEPRSPTAADIQKAMQGTWIITEYEMAGRTYEPLIGREVTIVDDKILDQAGKLTLTFKIDPQKNPVRIDLFAKQFNENKTLLGIAQEYGIIEVNDSTMTIAYGGRRPASFDDSPFYFVKQSRKPKSDKR